MINGSKHSTRPPKTYVCTRNDTVTPVLQEIENILNDDAAQMVRQQSKAEATRNSSEDIKKRMPSAHNHSTTLLHCLSAQLTWLRLDDNG